MLAVVAPAELAATAEAVAAPAVLAGGTAVRGAAAGTADETAEGSADGSWVTAWVVAADDCVRLLPDCCV